jgi:hypothetical protein
MRTHPYLVATLLALALHTPSWAQEATSRPQNPTDAAARSYELDRRAIEIQHQIMAARYNKGQEALDRAEKDLRAVQEERREALRALGKLP